ncbi:MAG TPA: hypothetical protein VFM58_04445 [Solirubrobacteraceae bacterium]|nr:hypothetical protein [Solirubrobacteraceae bacterium]
MAAVMAALPAAASAKGWVCEASALRVNLLGLETLEPAVANRGAGDCKPAAGGGSFAPALPLGLQAQALTAQTALAGPVAGPVQEQAGTAQATVARAGVASLPELPIALPDPDFSDVDAITVPGIGTVDLRPALEALIQPRALPDLDLLNVQAAHAEASAQCVSGVPRMRGSSALASLSVNGVEMGLHKATTETVRLIDSQSIDPSDIDVAKIVAPAGTDLGDLQILIEPILDALPDITVPATLARVRLVPDERLVSGTRITQRALHATITIAGRRFADVVVGEATAGVDDVSCGGVADLALQCTLRRLVLIDVYEQGHRVRLLGAADRRYVGKRVRIRFTATGRTVARPKVRRDGTFRATAPLPDARVRPTNRARYVATIGRQRSMRLKLQRRMIVRRMSARHGVVTIAGRVVGPFTSPMRKVLVKRRVTCRDWKVVKRFRPRSDGTFRVRLKAPKDGEAAVYRMTTRVKLYDWFAKTYPTFTLPRYVDLG